MSEEMNRNCYNCKYSSPHLFSERCACCYNVDMWEPKEGKKVKDKFTRNMLEDGMVVETRDGNRFLVCGVKLMSMDEKMPLSHYDDVLLHGGSRSLDIVRVYDKVNVLRQVEPTSCLKLLWERHEVKEVTLKEIAEKFGVNAIKVIDN